MNENAEKKIGQRNAIVLLRSKSPLAGECAVARKGAGLQLRGKLQAGVLRTGRLCANGVISGGNLFRLDPDQQFGTEPTAAGFGHTLRKVFAYAAGAIADGRHRRIRNAKGISSGRPPPYFIDVVAQVFACVHLTIRFE